MKTDIRDLSIPELTKWLQETGTAPYRARQIEKWIYMRGAGDFADMTDLSKNLRALLSTQFTIERLIVEEEKISKDGTRKFLFRLRDGMLVESVLIPERDHATLCISSQVGCAMGCAFCRTGKGGFRRNLTRGEILSQILDVRHMAGESVRLSNLVLMGMGEPLANYEAVKSALETITDGSFGLAFSARRVTVSTVGLVPLIDAFGKDLRVNLAVSLNAADDAVRSRLMPVNDTYGLTALMDACRRFPSPPNRRITFEYILIRGVNDSIADAKRLCKLLAGLRCKINLIPFHPHDGTEFEPSSPETVERFQTILLDRHFTVMVRRSMGIDIGAACGQLSGEHRDGGD